MSRLPVPGSDKGTWGSILNDYLLQAHNADGTIKDDAVTAASIAPNAVTSTSIAPNSISTTQLSSDIQTSLTNANAVVPATTLETGLIQLAGDLSGTATSPTVAQVNGIAISGTPSTGQVITATSTSAATWSTPSAIAPGGTVLLDSFSGASLRLH